VSDYNNYHLALFISDVTRFEALLFYLHTGEIKFAPFGSRKKQSLASDKTTVEDEIAPEASPKSIYRLADKARDLDSMLGTAEIT
jgi:hypothetical protein